MSISSAAHQRTPCSKVRGGSLQFQGLRGSAQFYSFRLTPTVHDLRQDFDGGIGRLTHDGPRSVRFQPGASPTQFRVNTLQLSFPRATSSGYPLMRKTSFTGVRATSDPGRNHTSSVIRETQCHDPHLDALPRRVQSSTIMAGNFSSRRREPGRADVFPGWDCIQVSSRTGVEHLSVLGGPNGFRTDPLSGTWVVAGWARGQIDTLHHQAPSRNSQRG